MSEGVGGGGGGEGGGLAASTRLTLQCVIHPVEEDPSTLKPGSFDLVIDVSVADLVFRSRVVSPVPTP